MEKIQKNDQAEQNTSRIFDTIKMENLPPEILVSLLGFSFNICIFFGPNFYPFGLPRADSPGTRLFHMARVGTFICMETTAHSEIQSKNAFK
jgi:hypothetical protein